MKLSSEEMEDLISLVGHPGWKSLLKMMDNIIEGLRCDVTNKALPPSVTDATVELYRLRAYFDGAKKLRWAVQETIANYITRLRENNQDGK